MRRTRMRVITSRQQGRQLRHRSSSQRRGRNRTRRRRVRTPVPYPNGSQFAQRFNTVRRRRRHGNSINRPTGASDCLAANERRANRGRRNGRHRNRIVKWGAKANRRNLSKHQRRYTRSAPQWRSQLAPVARNVTPGKRTWVRIARFTAP